MRSFLIVLFGVFFGALGAIHADRWLLASGWLPVPPVPKPVAQSVRSDSGDTFVYKGTVYAIRGGELVRQMTGDQVDVFIKDIKAGQQSPPSRIQHPQGEIYWSDPNRLANPEKR